MDSDSGIASLIRKAQAGDRPSFDALFATYAGRVEAFIRSQAGVELARRVEVHDLLQETFLQAWQDVGSFRGGTGGELFTWLKRIAEHTIGMQARRFKAKKRAAEGEVSLAQQVRTPEGGFGELAAMRIRFLDTNDRHGAFSVGLGGLRLFHAGQALDPSGWRATASSTYPGYDASILLAAPGAPEPPFKASLTPSDLRALRERAVRGRKLPILCVIYTRQVKERARAHLAEVDQVCLWTWRPADLKNLEANFVALEKLAPEKQLFLGCYTYDFHERKPMPVDLMRRQVEQGYEWLKAGRIAGIIFLATANVDVGLEAVEWTRAWIQAHGDERLRGAAAR